MEIPHGQSMSLLLYSILSTWWNMEMGSQLSAYKQPFSSAGSQKKNKEICCQWELYLGIGWNNKCGMHEFVLNHSAQDISPTVIKKGGPICSSEGCTILTMGTLSGNSNKMNYSKTNHNQSMCIYIMHIDTCHYDLLPSQVFTWGSKNKFSEFWYIIP